MMFLKSCPKCRGDLLLDKDVHGRYVTCLQCGFAKDIAGDHYQIQRALEPVPNKELKAA